MKNTTIFALVLLCFACGEQKTSKTETAPQESNQFPTDSLDYKLDSLYQIGIFNGFTGTVVDTSGILYNQGFGYADIAAKKPYTKQTVINIASISKVFIGVALMKAQEMGLLNLDDPINKHLPFAVSNPNFPNELITIRQLATHTSSIVDTETYMETSYTNNEDIPIANHLLERYETYYQNPLDQWKPLNVYMQQLFNTEANNYDINIFNNTKPGAIFDYSNVGAALCALVIESASEQPFYEFTQEHIFDPLKMNATAWRMQDAETIQYSKLYLDTNLLPYYTILSYPDGALITSSTDLGNFLVEWMKSYSGKGTLLSRASYHEIFKSQLPDSAFGGKENFNVGLFSEKELAYSVIGHTGGDPGTNTMMFFDTEKMQGRIFITNTDSDKENSKEVFWGIWDALGTYE